MANSVHIVSDTTFVERVAETLDPFVQANGCPVGRSQLSGLRQIAFNQPNRVKDFAHHQQQRAERKMLSTSRTAQERFQHEIEFWKLIADLCEGRQPRVGWSLLQEADASLPQKLKTESTGPEAKSAKEERKRWLAAWQRQHYPAFFQRFCAHYLYCLGKRGQ